MRCLQTIGLVFLALMAARVPAAEAVTAAQRFSNLEALLVRAGRFDLNAHVVSRGAIESNLEASLAVANENDVAIHLNGTLAGKPQNLVLRSDGVVTIITQDGRNQRLQPGRAMRQAVQIGFLRMGFMHNLMLLAHLQEPEHQKGDINPWVQVTNIGYASRKRANQIGLTFDVLIGGKKCGHATLWLDASTYMPIQREQSLTLKGEKVDTLEDYSNFIPTA